MDKSYVTLARCPICKGDTGEILLDKRLRPRFEMYTTTPYSVCDNCRKTYLKKGTMIINPQTGSLVVLKDTAFRRVFKKPIPANKIVFAEEGVLNRLQGKDTAY